MKARLLVLLFLVVMASGCISNIPGSENSKMNHSEAKEKSTTVVYENLFRSPEKYKGTLIEEEGRIDRVFDDGLTLHTEVLHGQIGSEMDVYDWAGDKIWVDTQNDFSIYEKDHYLKVYGEFKGTKTYKTSNGEYKTVPRIGTSYVLGSREKDVNIAIDTIKGSPERTEPQKVDRFCVGSSCKYNKSISKFWLEVGGNYTVKVTDSEFGNYTEEIQVDYSTPDYDIVIEEVDKYSRYGTPDKSPEDVVSSYVGDFPYSWSLLSPNLRVTGKENTEENRKKQKRNMRVYDEYAAVSVEDVETIYMRGNESKIRVYISKTTGDYVNPKNTMTTTVPLVKERKSWKIDRAFDPYNPNRDIQLNGRPNDREPVYPDN